MAEGLPLPPPAVLPAKFKGRPHAYVEHLNGGLLPYHDCGESAYNIIVNMQSTKSMVEDNVVRHFVSGTTSVVHYNL